MRSWERASRWVRSTPSFPPYLSLLLAHVSRSVYLFLSSPSSLSLALLLSPSPRLRHSFSPAPRDISFSLASSTCFYLLSLSLSPTSLRPSRPAASSPTLAPAIPHPSLYTLLLTLFSLITPPSCCCAHFSVLSFPLAPSASIAVPPCCSSTSLSL